MTFVPQSVCLMIFVVRQCGRKITSSKCGRKWGRPQLQSSSKCRRWASAAPENEAAATMAVMVARAIFFMAVVPVPALILGFTEEVVSFPVQ